MAEPPLLLSSLAMMTLCNATRSTTTPPPRITVPSLEPPPATSLAPPRPLHAALSTRGGTTSSNLSAPLPAFGHSETASAPGRGPAVPVDRMQETTAQTTCPRSSGLGLRAGNGHDRGTRCTRLGRFLDTAHQECVKTATFVLFSKLISHMNVDRDLYQENFAYTAMICDCIHLENIITHCFDFMTDMIVCMITTVRLPARSAQASALTSAQCCAWNPRGAEPMITMATIHHVWARSRMQPSALTSTFRRA